MYCTNKYVVLHVLQHCWRSKESAEPLVCTVTKGTSFVGTVKALLTAGILYPCISSHYSTFSVQKVFWKQNTAWFHRSLVFLHSIACFNSLHMKRRHSMKSQCQSLRLCGCSDILKSHKPADQSSIYQKLRKTSAACLFKPLLQSGMPDGKQLLSNKTHPWSCLGHNWLSFKYFFGVLSIDQGNVM